MACPSITRSLSATLKIEAGWNYIDTSLIGSPVERKRHQINYTFTDGATANKIQELYRDQRTITLVTGYEDLDLYGVLTDVYTETVELAKVRVLIIFNRSTTAGEDLLVGGAVENAWSAPFDDDDYGVWKIRALGHKILVAPLDGYTVTAGTADILRVMHAGVGSSITYDIIIAGTLS